MTCNQDVVNDFIPLGASTEAPSESARSLTEVQMQRAVADAYSSRDLVISDSSSSDDDDVDDVSYGDGAKSTPEKNIIASFPKRLLSMAENLDDASLVEAEAIAGIEDRVIAKNLRIFVFAIFLTLCIALPIIVHKTSRNKEVEAFEASFYSVSEKIFDSVQTKVDRQLSAANSLAIALTSHAAATSGVSWPFVTIPDWDLRADNVRDLGEFLSINLSPIVTEEQRFFWQVFTLENLNWLWEAQQTNITDTVTRKMEDRAGSLPSVDKMVQSTWSNQLEGANDMWSILNGQPISKDIYRPHPSGLGFAPEAPEHSPFLPMWLQMPAVSTMINLNVLSLSGAGSAANATMNTAVPTMSQVVDLKDVSSSQRALLSEYYTMLLQDYFKDPDLQYEGDPVAIMSFPVFDTFDSAGKTLVAELTAQIQFQQYFSNVLPEGSGGVFVVVSNSCGDLFSYEVTGEDAHFLGREDYHDPAFDHLMQTCDLAAMAESGSRSGHNFHPVLNSDFCRYAVTIYPSESFHKQYATNDPVVYAVVIAVVILFVSFVSMAYDLIVQRRMKRIIDAARNNKALLTSLYPDNVRERLLKEEQERKQRMVPRRNSNNSLSGGHGVSSRRSSAEHSKQKGDETPARRVSNENRDYESSGGRRRHSGDHLISDIFHSSVSGAVTGVATAVSGVSSGVSTVVTGVGTMAGFLMTPLAPSKLRLKFLLKEQDQKNVADAASSEKSEDINPIGKPIADLFPHCTVLFADIAGFTAWSSEREPEQVFALLQEIFSGFDRLAKRRDVFKVETIGDCYVAVTGLPDAQPDHAIRMVRFARSCMQSFLQEINRLEVILGPGTGNLRMRFGIHSGPVTAGVLRGEKSRFQLFGDTVNTASRVESTGQRNRIQVSQQTADLLIKAGKENWIVPRKGLVEAKGKGTIQTYWVLTRRAPTEVNPLPRPKFVPMAASDDSENDSHEGSDLGHDDEDDWENKSPNLWTLSQQQLREHYERLIDWQVELFSKILREIVAGRDMSSVKNETMPDPTAVVRRDGPVYEEVLECIQLPKFDPRAVKARVNKSESVELPPEVVSELHAFISTIASQYRQNPFHSYAHASHVVQSANKLLGRIVKPDLDWTHRRQSLNTIASEMHRFTYGITSDPLTHFAVLFATLIHDVDHSGVSNAQRGIEEPELATSYNNKSIAEQNSIDLAWQELSQSKYANLQKCLFATKDELIRFRQLTVNLVMATDIFEKDMKELRSRRWEKAFHHKPASLERKITPHTLEEDNNMRATIALEHIIQAADVSHCMQHWHVYKRWNERLFQEMFLAYEDGRGGKEPTEGWYNGELWFFDNYVIPLAKKLEECGVFGVSSDECLNYALENRKEWAAKGKEIVEEMVETYHQWRSRGEELINPFDLGDDPAADLDCNHNERGFPAPPLLDSITIRKDKDDGSASDDDDGSVIEA